VLSCSKLFIFKYIYRQSLTPRSTLSFGIKPQTAAHPQSNKRKRAFIEMVRYIR
jgi:hypothetical protein